MERDSKRGGGGGEGGRKTANALEKKKIKKIRN